MCEVKLEPKIDEISQINERNNFVRLKYLWHIEILNGGLKSTANLMKVQCKHLEWCIQKGFSLIYS